MPTDTTEKGLETLIMRHMTGEDGFSSGSQFVINDTPDSIAANKAGGGIFLSVKLLESQRAG